MIFQKLTIFLLKIMFFLAKIIDGGVGLISLTFIDLKLATKVARNISWLRYNFHLGNNE